MGKQGAAIVDMLEYLQKVEILSYLAQTDSPKLQFLRPRMDSRRLHIDSGYIRERKTVKQGQLDAVFTYLDGTDCRSKQLLAYFDEDNSKPCGICDRCLMRIKSENVEDRLMIELVELLSDGPLNIDQLVLGLQSGDEATRLAFIRKRLDEGKLKVNGDKYYLG